MPDYAIIRILGNENPPRDLPGSRLQSLEFILKHEPCFSGVPKLYLLNRLVDPEFEAQILGLLREYRASWLNVKLEWAELTLGLSDNEFNRQVIAINSARNVAIDFGHLYANHAIILDGDCIFDQTGWDQFVATTQLQERKYYSIPSTRTSPAEYLAGVTPILGESMLAFHRDAKLRFDANRLFGNREKLELLFRLGHDPTPNSGHCRIVGDLTCLAGYVCHLHTGTDTVESDVAVRMAQRSQSLAVLWQKVRERLALGTEPSSGIIS